MIAATFLTITDQVAEHLRAEIYRGRWAETMPGKHQLATELGINNKTVEAALRQLEQAGLLAGQGAGRKRRIVRPGPGAAVRPLRVAILLSEPPDRHLEYIVALQHELIEAGHTAIFPAKTLTELRFEVKRVARLVGQTPADVWVVGAGSAEVLRWFPAHSVPVFALFGRRRDLPIAGDGPDKLPALAAATRALIDLGHRRIVLLVRGLHRQPPLGPPGRVFLETLEARGIRTGDYNVPDWEESREGFQACLEALFRVTPPTALIVDESPQFLATLQFLARQEIQVPEDVSLIATDPDPNYVWCVPSIAHIRWDSRPVVRRIVRWAANVSRGREDVKQTSVAAEYVPGGTVGPASSHPSVPSQTHPQR